MKLKVKAKFEKKLFYYSILTNFGLKRLTVGETLITKNY